MQGLKVAVLGAGRIGKYHVREFSNLGAKVVAILGSSKESSFRTAEGLGRDFGITVKPYHLLEELLRNENIDAVSICTPPEMHENQIRLCLNKGLHVMCEKPFVQTNNNDYETARELLDLAEKNKKILTVNTQWATIVNYLKKYKNLDSLKRVSISMESEKRGVDMLKDHLPHTNSVLIKLVPGGKADKIEFLLESDEAIIVGFEYKNQEKVCNVKYDFKSRTNRPGQIIFSLDEKSFKREIGSGYRQSFVTDQSRFEIEDPLMLSIRMFLEACKGSGVPLVGKKEILENMLLTEQILGKYIS